MEDFGDRNLSCLFVLAVVDAVVVVAFGEQQRRETDVEH